MPLVAVICLVVFPPWNGIRAWMAPLPNTIQEELNQAIEYGLDGIVVYVDQAGKPAATYAAGWSNKATQTPADPNVLFKIGSISKLYVAVAAAKLAGSHQLQLDETLAFYAPELKNRIENADQVTVRMMLQHRSGIPNFTDQPVYEWANPPSSPTESLELILGKPADFEPDARYAYSNTNYLLIGRVLDTILGYHHRDYVQSEILSPLGLTHTYSNLSQTNIEEVMSGYHHPYEDDFRDVHFVNPSGSMVASAQDVGVFLRALNNGSLFNEEEKAIYSSVYEYGHKGWVLGYQSTAFYHPELDAVVVQFVNTTGENSELTTQVVYNRIVEILKKEYG